MVLTLVMTSLLPRLYDVPMFRCFSVLILLCQQVTHNKTISKKTCLIIVTDVNMTSKTSISSKSNGVAKFNDPKKGFYLMKIIVFGVFLSQRSPQIMPSAKRKQKI